MPEPRPVIGICTSLIRARWGLWNEQTALTPFAYVTAIQRAGGLALMIPPDPGLEQSPDAVLELIDGLMLAGGEDIDPGQYGAAPHPMTVDTVPERDRVELALTWRAVQCDLPVLGICRGMQVLNVAMGGTLKQHLPEEYGHEDHRRFPGSFEGADHDVRLTPGSLAASAAGHELHATKSHHHQGVDRIGQGLQVTGVSTLDDLPEAVEDPARRFVLGVQWHPEADQTSRVIAALVAAAGAYRTSRAAIEPNRRRRDSG